MINNIISQDEFNVFKGISTENKVRSMELYLIEGYNMKEVGCKVFGKDDRSFSVSLIHRCYNFSGKNSGKYRKGCEFQRYYNYQVSRKDIKEFIYKYPTGTFYNGITFEDFLIDKVKQFGTREYNVTVQNDYVDSITKNLSNNRNVRGYSRQQLEEDYSDSLDWNYTKQSSSSGYSNNRVGNYLNSRESGNYSKDIKNNKRSRNPNILFIAIIIFLMFITMITSGTIFTYWGHGLILFIATVGTFTLWWKS